MYTFRPVAGIVARRQLTPGHSRPIRKYCHWLTVTRGHLLAYRMGVPLAASCLKLARILAIRGRGFLRTLAVSRTLPRIGNSTLAAVVVAA